MSHLYGGMSVSWQFGQFTFCMVENFIFLERQISLKKDKLLHIFERKNVPLQFFCGSSLEKCQLISVELWIDPPKIECNTKTQALYFHNFDAIYKFCNYEWNQPKWNAVSRSTRWSLSLHRYLDFCHDPFYNPDIREI